MQTLNYTGFRVLIEDETYTHGSCEHSMKIYIHKSWAQFQRIISPPSTNFGRGS